MLRGFLHTKCPRIYIVVEGTSGKEVEVIVDTGIGGIGAKPLKMLIYVVQYQTCLEHHVLM